jgi:hypothetical protein
LLVVVGVVALIFYGIYLWWSSSSQAIASINPDELTALKGRCVVAMGTGASLGNGEFYSFKSQKFSGKLGFASCCYDTVYDSLKADSNYASSLPLCENKLALVTKYCKDNVAPADFGSLIIDGYTCKIWGVAGKKCTDYSDVAKNIKSEWVPSVAACINPVIPTATAVAPGKGGQDITKSVQDTSDKTAGNTVCCLYNEKAVSGTNSVVPVLKEKGAECDPYLASSECKAGLTCGNIDTMTNKGICG